MIWDSNSCNIEELNVNEREHAMHFHNSSIVMLNILERVCR